MTALAVQSLAQLVAERALNSLPGGLLIAAFSWLILRLAGKPNSGTRFAVWFSALIAIAGLPFVSSLGHQAAIHAPRAEIMLPGVWAVTAFAVWILLASLAAIRLGVGLWNVRRLRKNAVDLEPSHFHSALRETLAQCDAGRPVRVCASPAVRVPTAIGFFKPMILIPEWALRLLPLEELKIILLHEAAHLRRWDDWTNLVQKVVGTVFFFHPAVWWVEKRLTLEREMACDDAVLAKTGNARAYAECLVSLAQRSFVQRGLAMAQAAISHARATSIRLAQILDQDRPRATRVFMPALGLIAVFAGLCIIMLQNTPHLIAFENSGQPCILAAATADIVPRTQAPIVPVTAGISAGRAGTTRVQQVAPTPVVYWPSRVRRVSAVRHALPRVAGVGQERHRAAVTSVTVAAKQIAPGPELLLVMQTTEFDDRGSVVFSVSVWRVTFASPSANSVRSGVLAESI